MLLTSVEVDSEQEIQAIEDRGSSNTLVISKIINSFDYYFSSNLLCAGWQKLKIIGKKELKIKINGESDKWTFLVVEGLLYNAQIDRDFLSHYKVLIDCSKRSLKVNRIPVSLMVLDKTDKELSKITLPEHLDKLEKGNRTKLLNSYKYNIFSSHKYDIGSTNLGHHSIDTEGSKPVASHCYRLSTALKEEALSKIQLILDNKIIRSSNSSWRSPVTLPRKKDGTLRFCVGYRNLNSITKNDSYPLPCIDEIVEKLNGYIYYTTFDLSSAFWRIPIKDDVTKVVKNCISCSKYKPFKNIHRAKLKPIAYEYPLKAWHTDFIRSLLMTDSGNRYILIFIDPFSKWIEAYSTPDQTA